MDEQATTRAATQVGLITLPIGLALVTVPAPVGRLLGTGDYDTALRVIGALDLAIAGYCLQLVRRGDGGRGAKVAAAAMVGATLSDGRALTRR